MLSLLCLFTSSFPPGLLTSLSPSSLLVSTPHINSLSCLFTSLSLLVSILFLALDSLTPQPQPLSLSLSTLPLVPYLSLSIYLSISVKLVHGHHPLFLSTTYLLSLSFLISPHPSPFFSFCVFSLSISLLFILSPFSLSLSPSLRLIFSHSLS